MRAPEQATIRFGSDKVTLVTYLPDEVRRALRALAIEDQRSLANYVALVLTEHVNRKGGEA